MSQQVCAAHSNAAAGWQCQHCDRLLCPQCVARVALPRADLGRDTFFDACTHCDGPTRVLLVPGAATRFTFELRQTLRVPVSTLGLGVGAALLAAFVALRHLSSGAWAAGVALGVAPAFWILFFAGVRSAARGGQVAAVATAAGDVLGPAIRAWILSGIAGAVVLAIPSPFAQWLLGAALLLLAPSVLIALALGSGVFEAVAPTAVMRRARALGGDYAWLAAISGGVGAACAWWSSAARFGRFNGVAFLPLVLNGLALYALLVLARCLGLLLSVRADAVGGELPPEALVPALPGGVPAGRRRGGEPSA